MSKQGRTKLKLVPPKTRLENQRLETLEETSPLEQREEPVNELDIEIECPRCNEVMELRSSFDRLAYRCESCSFMLKCF
jgi:Zn finger protein HypA/HybF involved in hydrogenase expression